MTHSPGGVPAIAPCARGGAARALAAAAWLVLLGVSGCDQFSAEGVARTCVASALKDGEPYGNEIEREKNEAQLREYCRAAAQGH